MHTTSGVRDPALSFVLPTLADDASERRQANRALGVSAQAADTPVCVTPHERYSVRIGWTRHHVAVVFDTKGKVLNEQGYIYPNWRVYKRCSTSGYNLGIKYHRNSSGIWHAVQKPVIGD